MLSIFFVVLLVSFGITSTSLSGVGLFIGGRRMNPKIRHNILVLFIVGIVALLSIPYTGVYLLYLFSFYFASLLSLLFAIGFISSAKHYI